MTQPRKPDEVAFFAALRNRAASDANGYWGGRSGAEAVMQEVGINEKRAFYLLEKWYGKGWIECGTWVWGGWFTETAPQELTA